jgi:ribosomal protein L24E
LIAAIAVGPCASGSSRAAGPGAPAKLVVQRQVGVAAGNYSVSLFPEPTAQRDAGTYASTGQLGRGRYQFDLTYTARPGPTYASGTARIVRSDGAVLTGTVTASACCSDGQSNRVTFKVAVARGTRDLVGAQLTFAGSVESYVTRSGSAGTELLVLSGTSSATTRIGYWMVGSGGTVYSFGGAEWLGNAPTATAVHIEATPTRNGYWIVDASGRVFAFGDARWLGNADPGVLRGGEAIVSLSASPSGRGYWLFTNRGRVLPFGDARDYGDLHAAPLNAPVVGSVATPTGTGYYMVAADGGVFTFGDARFRGSTGAMHLNQPVLGLVPTADNRGYWLVAADGGVFAFNARFLGSTGNVRLNQPVAGMVRYGTGYMMVARDGGIFNFSRQLFFGSLGAAPPALAITGAASVG